MRKNLIIRLVLMIALVPWMNSCSSEEDLLNKQEEKYSKKFQVFSAKKEEAINYGNGFKTLLERYDEINKVQHTAKSLKNAWKNSSQIADEYVEFNIRSQDITTKNKEKYTLFPLIKNYAVEGIIIAVLKENDTQVEFLKMSTEADNYEVILELFRAQYLKSNLKNKSLNKGAGGGCGFSGYPPCDIEPVVITIGGGGGGGGGSLPPGGGWVPPGGCGPYEDCLHNPDAGGTAGSGNTPTDNPITNPCENIKGQTNNATFKSNISTLEGKTGLKKETGYIQRTDGTYTYNDAAGQTNNSNTLSLPLLDLPENKNITGFIHTHVNNYTYTDSNGDEVIRIGIKMFSPADVAYFMDMLKNAQDAGRPLADIYAIMVTSMGNYQIRFTGNQYQIKSFTKEQIDGYRDSYKTNMVKSENLELNFLNFISEKMNIKGLNLYKMNSDGSNKEIKLNGDKTSITTTPCP